MLRFRWTLLTLSLLVTIGITAKDSREALTVNLSFVPQEGVQTTSPDMLPAMLEQSVDIRLEDRRGGDAPLTIGQGTNDEDQPFPIQSSDALIPYLADTLREVATAWGLKVEQPAKRVLHVRVIRFNIDESNKALGSMYAAEVKLTFLLEDGAGKQLIEGAASGSAHRYGRARSTANCNEVLSDSLKEAFANVLSDPKLQRVWSSGTSAGGAGGGSSAESVEERLRKLDDLLKKGLITKDEYNRKRAEILKDV